MPAPIPRLPPVIRVVFPANHGGELIVCEVAMFCQLCVHRLIALVFGCLRWYVCSLNQLLDELTRFIYHTSQLPHLAFRPIHSPSHML